MLWRLQDAQQIGSVAAPDAGSTPGEGLSAWQSRELDAIAEGLVSEHLRSEPGEAGEVRELLSELTEPGLFCGNELRTCLFVP